MATEVQQLSSNVTETRFAKQANPRDLVASPRWFRGQVNSYPQFGPQVTSVAREIIDTSGQQEVGDAVDLDAGGGVNEDLTQETFTEFWPSILASESDAQAQNGGVLDPATPTVVATGYDIGTDAAAAGYKADDLVWAEGFATIANNGLKVVTGTAANVVEVTGLTIEAGPPVAAKIGVVGFQGASGDIGVDNSGSRPVLTSVAHDFTADLIEPGDYIWIGGRRAGQATNALSFDDDENTGLARVLTITVTGLTIDLTPGRSADGEFQDMITDAGAAKTIQVAYGDSTRNQRRNSVKTLKQYWRVERLLGNPNPVANPGINQAESLIGSVVSEAVINLPLANKITVDLTFLSTDAAQHSGQAGDEIDSDGATIFDLPAANAYNTSRDLMINDLASIGDGTDPTPPQLVGIVTEMTMNASLNAEALKGQGIFGAFDVSLGAFVMGSNITAYFTDVASQQAVRNSDQVLLAYGVAKVANGRRQGTVFSLPRGTLGDGRLNVQPNQPIRLPLTFGGARDPNLDYTLKVLEYRWLPS